MDSHFRFAENRGAFLFSRLVLWIAVFHSAFCGSGAALPTFYVEDLCKAWRTAVVDLRYTESGILTSLSSEGDFLECDVELKPAFGSSVVLSLYKYSLEPQEQLVIEDADKFKMSLIGDGDFPDQRKSFQSDGLMTLHYTKNLTTVHRGNLVKFQFVFTRIGSRSPCGYEEFECRNRNCIPEKLLCDRHNNCGDKSDEEDCGPRKKGEGDSMTEQVTVTRVSSSYWILAIVVCGVVFAVVVTVFLVVLVRGIVKRKKDAQKAALATVASSGPPSSPQVVVPSVFAGVRQSLGGARKNQSIEQAAQERNPDTYQVPSMYPGIPSAPEYTGVDNPEFEADE